MDFHYSLDIAATAEEVFVALTNPFQIELWSGYSADMQPEPGYLFSLWDGDISGVNIKIDPGKFLQQEWFFGENGEPSIVTIILKKRGSDTTVSLTHTNIPDEVADEIVLGWKEYYLGAIKNLLEAC